MIFTQAVTISVALLFVVSTLKPEWVSDRPALPAITIQEAIAPATAPAGRTTTTSYAEAAQRALPAVVHIFTSKDVKSQRHPFADDPLFRHFFGVEKGTGRSTAFMSVMDFGAAGPVIKARLMK